MALFAILRTRVKATPDFEPNAFAFRMQFGFSAVLVFAAL
jgi:hypothetical protein